MKITLATIKVNLLIGTSLAARWVYRWCVAAIEEEKRYWEAQP